MRRPTVPNGKRVISMPESEPLPGFVLDLGGVSLGRFGECRGPAAGEVTLEFGVTASAELREWLLHGGPRSVSIIEQGGAGHCFALTGCRPVRWKGASVDSAGEEFALESLTLSYESVS